jgi:hypothetical protein
MAREREYEVGKKLLNSKLKVCCHIEIFEQMESYFYLTSKTRDNMQWTFPESFTLKSTDLPRIALQEQISMSFPCLVHPTQFFAGFFRYPFLRKPVKSRDEKGFSSFFLQNVTNDIESTNVFTIILWAEIFNMKAITACKIFLINICFYSDFNAFFEATLKMAN